MLALLLTLALGAPKVDTGMPPPLRIRAPATATASSGPTFTLAQSYAWPSSITSAGRLPVCVGDSTCVRLCRVNSGGTAWECIDNTGAAAGTITQGTGTTYFDSPITGVKAINDVTDATAPRTTDTGINAMWAGDFTVVVGGYSTTQTASTQALVYADSGGGSGCLLLRQESNVLVATFCESGSFPTSVAATSAADGYMVGSVRRSGNNRITRVNGTDGATVSTSTTKAAANAGAVTYFGRGPTGGQPQRGPLGFVAFFNVSKTAAELRAIELAFWGATGLVAGGTNALIGVDHTAISGQVDLFHSGAYMVSTAGLRTITTNTNYWAADPLAAATWTDVGTPTVTSNAASGPFSRWKNAAEVDELVDDDGAAFEGKMGATAGTTLGMYTASCFLAAGTTGTITDKARLVISTDGTLANGSCDFSGISAGWATRADMRKTCTGTVTGSPTFIRGQVLVGNAASDTGSIRTSQCQLNRYGFAGAPAVTNTIISQVGHYADASGWPSPSSKGKYEFVFTPKWSPVSGWYATGQEGSTVYVFDTVDSTPNHTVAQIWGYTVAGRFYGVVQNGASTHSVYVDSQDLTPGQQYVASTEWSPSGSNWLVTWRRDTCADATTCHASTVIGSTTLTYAPGIPAKAYLGTRFDGSFTTATYFAALRVYQ